MLTWKTIVTIFLALIILSIALTIVAVILWSSGEGTPHRGPVTTVPQHRSR